jgi:hypothetical protein
MKPFNEYYSKAPYPKEDDFYVYKRVSFKDETKEVRFFDKERYNEEVARYRESQKRLDKEFKDDLFEHLGITNNPKANDLYHIAYELGHSSGFSEIANYAYDLVKLIR